MNSRTCIYRTVGQCAWQGMVSALLLALPAGAGLTVVDLGQRYTRDSSKTPGGLYAAASDSGGSTSVRRMSRESLIWKSQGYFQRNRELGQIFNVPAGETITLDAIVLRTGNSASAVKAGARGAAVKMQIFEVVGTPVINNNSTPPGTRSEHGFNTNHLTDDYIEGVTYIPLRLAKGGTFPNTIPPTTRDGGEPGHLRYLRWDLTGRDELTLEDGRRYGFMVGFSSPGELRSFTLGNNNNAAASAAPTLRTDSYGKQWWCIRREGNGTLPPTQVPGSNPPVDPVLRATLQDESLHMPGYDDPLSKQFLSPTSNGYPDVDTYRELEFYIELKPQPVPPPRKK